MCFLRPSLILILRGEKRPRENQTSGENMSSATLQNLSNDLAAAADSVGPAVVAVHAQHRIPSSGIQWREDVIVTVNHGIRRSEEISVLLGPGKSAPATTAGP